MAKRGLCGATTVSQVALYMINSCYLLISFIVIGVAAAARVGSVVENIPILGGVLSTGVLLLFISLFGIIGTARGSKPLLFIYMILLSLLFVIQFSVSIASLSVSSSQQHSLLAHAWCGLSDADKGHIQVNVPCFGFEVSDQDLVSDFCMKSPRNRTYCPIACRTPYCEKEEEQHGDECPTCYGTLESSVDKMLRRGGGVGLAFAFTEFLGVWAAAKYRSTKQSVSVYREFL